MVGIQRGKTGIPEDGGSPMSAGLAEEKQFGADGKHSLGLGVSETPEGLLQGCPWEPHCRACSVGIANVPPGPLPKVSHFVFSS